MASLDVEQLAVDSFETSPGDDSVTPPYPPRTNEVPNCYSPLCIPTDLPEQCDAKADTT